MPWWVIVVLVFGANITLWGTIGLFRLIDQGSARLLRPWRRRHARSPGAHRTAWAVAGRPVAGTAAVSSEASPALSSFEASLALPAATAGATAGETPGLAPDGDGAQSSAGLPAARSSDELTVPFPAVTPETAAAAVTPETADDGEPGGDTAPAAPVPARDGTHGLRTVRGLGTVQALRTLTGLHALRDLRGLHALRRLRRLRRLRGLRGLRGNRNGKLTRRRMLRKRSGELARRRALTVNDVAVLIPAHNEAVVIEDSIRAVLKLVPPANVHVVSDGSTDDTYEIAASTGVNAIKTRRNVGKAGALQEAIQRFMIVQRFPAVMLLDADTRVQPRYFEAALPMFDDPRVAAVAGCVKTARDRKLTLVGNVLVGHRQRIYSIGQHLMKFGQTWRLANATHIVPGFASVYRTDVLPQMEMNPPGLVIEDFNMTFEVYQRRLGTVGFSLRAIAVTEDPDNFRDYVKQTRRWALGLWQTVRRHPPRRNLFSAMLALMLLELVTASLLFLLLPVVLLVLVLPYLDAGILALPGFGSFHALVAAHMNLRTVGLGVGVPDYVMTILAAALERQPRLLLYGFLFPLLRVVDAVIGISAIPLAWFARSTGKWKSPVRRQAVRAAGEPGAVATTDAVADDGDSEIASAVR